MDLGCSQILWWTGYNGVCEGHLYDNIEINGRQATSNMANPPATWDSKVFEARSLQGNFSYKVQPPSLR
jgi:hypothetical protein